MYEIIFHNHIINGLLKVKGMEIEIPLLIFLYFTDYTN